MSDSTKAVNPTLSFNCYPPEVALGGDLQFSIICRNGSPGMTDLAVYDLEIQVLDESKNYAVKVWDSFIMGASDKVTAAAKNGSFVAVPLSVENPEEWTDSKSLHYIKCIMRNQGVTVTRTLPITFYYDPETYDLHPYETQNYDFTNSFNSFASGAQALPDASLSISRSASDFIRAGFDVFPSILTTALVAVLVIRVVRMVILKK